MSKPILVCMVWRGGARFQRCLDSIAKSREYFSRIVLSITSAPDSDDMRLAEQFARSVPGVEVICTRRELPTMRHQAFWIEYLQRTGTQPHDWIYWLAYDDEVRLTGVQSITDANGIWPLEAGTAYFGPWAMRHEQADRLYDGPGTEPLESWTSFPIQGPLRMPVAQWIGRQLEQPTYMQMSGSVCAFENYLQLRDSRPHKTGPMRIEMATAAAAPNTHVQEFTEPVSIIYGRPNSDRASYGRAARKEDLHLVTWLARHVVHHPEALPKLAAAAAQVAANYARVALGRSTLPQEQWVSRGHVAP